MSPNVDLLKRTLAHIEAHPDRWDQMDWRNTDADSERCGTACCFAGWAAILNGSTWDVPDDQVRQQLDLDEDRLMEVDGGVMVSDAARDALGLTGKQADQLFDCGNRLRDLRSIVGELCGEAS